MNKMLAPAHTEALETLLLTAAAEAASGNGSAVETARRAYELAKTIWGVAEAAPPAAAQGFAQLAEAAVAPGQQGPGRPVI